MANWLSELGVEVTVYSPNKAPNWFALKCNFVSESNIKKLYNSIKEEIIVAYSVLEIPELLQYHQGTKRIYHLAQVVEDFHYHGNDFDSLMMSKGIFELLHSLPVGRISVSKHINDYIAKRHNQKTYLIENGIDLLNFAPRNKNTIEKEVTISCVASTGRILKGVDDILTATEILADKLDGYDINLIIVSSGKPDNEFQIEHSSKKFRLSILYNLTQHEMRDIYRKSDIYVNASWYEGFGLPTIEAMACGTPVVQADNLGLDGIVEDGVNCLLFKPADAFDMAGKIELLING